MNIQWSAIEPWAISGQRTEDIDENSILGMVSPTETISLEGMEESARDISARTISDASSRFVEWGAPSNSRMLLWRSR
jgi:hypothetical protein